MLHDDIGTQKDLILSRIETAKDDIKAAEILRDAESYRGANNRAYYAVFHAINGKRQVIGCPYE